MRSRYTAFCLGNVDYLVATQHPSQRHRRDSAILSHTIRTTTWQGLTILATKQGKPRDKRGTVEFVARFRNGEGEIANCMSDRASSKKTASGFMWTAIFCRPSPQSEVNPAGVAVAKSSNTAMDGARAAIARYLKT
jgi:uncharacterized protein YchJ